MVMPFKRTGTNAGLGVTMAPGAGKFSIVVPTWA